MSCFGVDAPRRLACATLLTVATATADTIVLRGQPPLTNVHIVHCSTGRVAFIGRGRRLVRVSLADVERIELDRCPSLTAAEQVRRHWPSRAAAALDELLRNPELPGWLRTLALARSIEPLEHCGRFDQAVGAWVRLATRDPRAAEAVRLSRPPAPGSAQLSVAIRTLRAALGGRLDHDVRRRVRRLWLELLLIDGRPLPAGLAARSQTLSTPDARPDADGPPRLFADAAAAMQARTRTVIELDRDSLVLTAAIEQAASGRCATARRILEASRPFARPADRGAWQAAALYIQGCDRDPAAAAVALERLAATMPDPQLAARALRLAASAWKRAGRDDLARAASQRARRRAGSEAAPPDDATHTLQPLTWPTRPR